MKSSRNIGDLLAIMAALRTPGSGCPWDLEQDFASIAPYTIEEAYEVADAIERGDRRDLADELGDLLLQVVFHSRLAEEEGAFAFGDVVEAITSKMIRRHPHVFGDVSGLTPDEVKGLWSTIKLQENRERTASRAATGQPDQLAGALAGVPVALPALTRALKLQEKASRVGFDWNDVAEVIAKLREEITEVEVEIETGNAAKAREEVGDLLFAIVNLARHLNADPERALRGTNTKFERRFRHIESRLAESGRPIGSASLEEMESYWIDAKRLERLAKD